MPLEYELLNDHTLIGKEATNTGGATVLFNFVSPRRILATGIVTNNALFSTSVTTEDMNLDVGTEAESIIKLQDLLAKKGGAPLGGFLKDVNNYPSAPK